MALEISHYSDVLCVWAYVSQIRIEEMRESFEDKIALDYRFMSIFGAVPHKLETSWGHRGGAAAFRDHVHSSCARFEHIKIHEDIWTRNTPTSSMPSHLFLCAVKGLEGVTCQTLNDATWAVRCAFFRDLKDVSQKSTLFEIAEAMKLDRAKLEASLDSGEAHAMLAQQIAQGRDQSIRVSPSLVLDGGRQILAGNVGYRVIEANVRELLQAPASEFSWC